MRRERTFRVFAGIISVLTLYVVVQEGTEFAEGGWLLSRWSLIAGLVLFIPMFALYAIGGQRAVDPVMGWMIKVAEVYNRSLDRIVRKYIVMPPEPEHVLPRRNRPADAALPEPERASNDDPRTNH